MNRCDSPLAWLPVGTVAATALSAIAATQRWNALATRHAPQHSVRIPMHERGE